MKALKPTILALICGLLLTLTNQQLRGVIEENQLAFEQRLLREMVNDATLVSDGDDWKIVQGDQVTGRLVSVVTERGYNGRISMFVAYSTFSDGGTVLNGNTVLNVRVSEHRETPGIGDFIDIKVSDWMFGFNGRSIQQTPKVQELDGMTGATITSDAVKLAVSEAISQ